MHLLITMWGCIQCFHKLWEETGSWSCCKFKQLSLSMVKAHFQKRHSKQHKDSEIPFDACSTMHKFCPILSFINFAFGKKGIENATSHNMNTIHVCKKTRHLSIDVLYHSPSIPLQILTSEHFLDIQII